MKGRAGEGGRAERRLGLVDGDAAAEAGEVLELQVLAARVGGIAAALGGGTYKRVRSVGVS